MFLKTIDEKYHSDKIDRCNKVGCDIRLVTKGLAPKIKVEDREYFIGRYKRGTSLKDMLGRNVSTPVNFQQITAGSLDLQCQHYQQHDLAR